MKTILVISSTPFFGGAEHFIVETLSYLKENFQVHFIVNNVDVKKKLYNDDVRLFKSESFFGKIKEVKSYAKEISADLLLFNGSNIAYSLPLFKGYKKIYYRHTTNTCAPSNRRFLFKFLMNAIYRKADLTIHVSDYSRFEQKKGNAITIHNGIELPARRALNPIVPLKILYCGRLEQSKGIREIITAFNNISKDKAKLTIIGDGADREWVRNNAKETINFLGFQEDVEKFYREADALILMSEFENFPLSIIEAMSYGLPILTTGVGGISEMVKDGYNGIIIPRDSLSIKIAIETLVKDPSRMVEMGNNSRTFCEENLNIMDKVNDITKAINSVL